MAENEETLGTQSPDKGNDEIPSSAREALEEAAPPPQSEPDDTLDDHKERSRLGRRFTKFEQEIDGLKQTISQLNTVLSQRQDPYVERAMSQPLEEKPPVEYITTPDDLEKYEAWREDQVARKRNAYANRYVHSIKNLTYMSPDMHTEIEQELLTNVGEYPTYSKFSDPAGDAQKNYMKAENKLLKQRLGAKPQPNVRGGQSAPTGVSANTRINAPLRAPIKLDEYASKFVKHLGEAEDSEWVQTSVSDK